MTPKEAFLTDLRLEQKSRETVGIPYDNPHYTCRVGVEVMRNHSKYFKPDKSLH